MKTITSQQEVDEMIVDGVLRIDGDVRFAVSVVVKAHIIVSGDITAWNITARAITARDISANDISAGDITAWNITARDISANDILARNITAGNITARDISFFAVAVAYKKFKCKSITGQRENSKFFCLDGDVEIKEGKGKLKGGVK